VWPTRSREATDPTVRSPTREHRQCSRQEDGAQAHLKENSNGRYLDTTEHFRAERAAGTLRGGSTFLTPSARHFG